MNKIYEDLSIVQIKVLSLIAWADGVVTKEEEEFYNNVLEVSPCSDETRKDLSKHIKKSPSLNDVLESIVSIPKEISISILRNAYAIAAADGEINPKEIEIIDQLAFKLGIEKKNINTLHKWLELSFQVEVIETKLFNTKF